MMHLKTIVAACLVMTCCCSLEVVGQTLPNAGIASDPFVNRALAPSNFEPGGAFFPSLQVRGSVIQGSQTGGLTLRPEPMIRIAPNYAIQQGAVSGNYSFSVDLHEHHPIEVHEPFDRTSQVNQTLRSRNSTRSIDVQLDVRGLLSHPGGGFDSASNPNGAVDNYSLEFNGRVSGLFFLGPNGNGDVPGGPGNTGPGGYGTGGPSGNSNNTGGNGNGNNGGFEDGLGEDRPRGDSNWPGIGNHDNENLNDGYWDPREDGYIGDPYGEGSGAGGAEYDGGEYDGGELPNDLVVDDTNGPIHDGNDIVIDLGGNDEVGSLADNLNAPKSEFSGYDPNSGIGGNLLDEYLTEYANEVAEDVAEIVLEEFLENLPNDSTFPDYIADQIEHALRDAVANAVTSFVDAMFAVDELVESESQIRELIGKGEFKEAWSETWSASVTFTLETVVNSAIVKPFLEVLSEPIKVFVQGVLPEIIGDFVGSSIAGPMFQTVVEPINNKLWELYDAGYVPIPKIPRNFFSR